MPLIRDAMRSMTERGSPFKWGRYTSGGTSLMMSRAGERVSSETAMLLAAVYRAVTLISTSIASMPMRVIDENPQYSDGRSVDVSDQYRDLLNNPNPEVPPFTFWSSLLSNVVLTGDAFVYVRDVGGVTEYWPVQPHRVVVERVKDSLEKQFVVDGTLVYRSFNEGGEIIHIPWMSEDGLRGVSPIAKARESLGLHLASNRVAARFFRVGSTPGGYLTTEQDVSQNEANEIMIRWEDNHAGASDAHRIAVLGKGIEWNSTMLNPSDAQLLDTRKFEITEVARWFGVPPFLLFDVERSTSWGSGIAEQGRGFVNFTLTPYMTLFSQAFSSQLGDGHKLVFDSTELQLGTVRDRVQSAERLLNLGFEHNGVLKAMSLPSLEMKEKEDMDSNSQGQDQSENINMEKKL